MEVKKPNESLVNDIIETFNKLTEHIDTSERNKLIKVNPPNDGLKNIADMLQHIYTKAFVSNDSGIATSKCLDYHDNLSTWLNLIKEEYTYREKICKKVLLWETYIEVL
ncbi:PIR Superfamily Protein [Plasmodium ovale wallikeri]|uniref:PIR Superfamily Protein n=1 Tax=Plasmodium ovale wallikeri TaxID=864142 RepID=A0A1A9AG76_PLAOA|nr:PIR Superfamily Protein [Plasmodium ovale wallikeri]SBT58808.1 PIR Superfamily Protein [Plasmodium ovale wallikeri]